MPTDEDMSQRNALGQGAIAQERGDQDTVARLVYKVIQSSYISIIFR